ncbi:MAG: hypothetical protein HQM00_17080, partial [Magnetococcales bacterium]|nr:hypothetical protein [Magnetococcales bacterium]
MATSKMIHEFAPVTPEGDMLILLDIDGAGTYGCAPVSALIGPQGDTGATGPQGPQGIQGD